MKYLFTVTNLNPDTIRMKLGFRLMTDPFLLLKDRGGSWHPGYLETFTKRFLEKSGEDMI